MPNSEKGKAMISVVCVYNDETVANRYIFKSLCDQTVPYELIALDNRGGRFVSAAEALNFGAKQAKGDYLMFVHQDVELCSCDWLADVEKNMKTIADLGIAGVAGREKNGRRTLTNIKHGVPPEDVKKSVHVKNPEKVQTLDECLAIVPKTVFDRLEFDEKTCDSWHAYVVDYCLSVKKLGFEAYVLPAFAYHKSRGFEPKNMKEVVKNLGRFPREYYQTIEKILVKHGKEYRLIRTTCGDWDPNFPFFLQKLLKFVRSTAIFYKQRISVFIKGIFI